MLWRQLPLVCGAGLFACAPSPSMILKTPVSNQCAQTGLTGCDVLSEGVLLYLEGNKDEGLRKLAAGSAKNSPERIRKFAELLGQLDQVPGASKYTASLEGIVLVLTSGDLGDVSATSESGNVPQAPDSTVPAMTASFENGGGLNADSDPAQIRDGVVSSPDASPSWCSAVFGVGTTCAVVSWGPLFLTDASPSGPNCRGQLLAVVDGIRLKASFESPVRMHGARVLIRKDQMLVFAQRSPPPEGKNAQPSSSDSVVLEEGSTWDCSLYVSGFVPYGTDTHLAERPTADWDF